MSVDLGDGLTLPRSTRLVRYHDDAAWLRDRRTYLGASRVPQVLGLSPYGGPWAAWSSLCLDGRGIDTPATRRGRREEPRILEDYAEETGHRVVGPLTRLVVLGLDPWAGCSPDAFAFDGASWGLVEAKTDRTDYRWGPSGTVIERWTQDAARVVREDYAIQCYAQMAWTGLTWCRLVVRRHLDDLRILTLLADASVEALISERCGAFWRDHVATRTPPAVDDSEACAHALAALHPASEDRALIDATEDDRALVREREAVRAEIARLEAARRAIDARLAQRIGTAYGLQWPSADPARPAKVLWQTSGGETRLDVTALEHDHPDIARTYRREVPTTRTIRVYLQETP